MLTFFIRMTWITLCLFILAAAASSQQEKPTPTPPPPIIYTGKLIGYFRSPSLQTSTLKGCPSAAQTRGGATAYEKASNAAAVVLREKSPIPEGAILLGTGDNFSPQFEARTFSPAPLPASSGAPADGLPPAQKELYSWYQEQNRWVYYEQIEKKGPFHDRLVTGTNTIPSDNVACYLAAAGYTAVVPGKHDFYFGPERLRQLARFMADTKETGLGPVQMLGTNLVIKTSLINPPEVAQDKKKWGWPENVSVLNVADGGEVYPWLTHARVKLAEFTPHSTVSIDLRKLLNREVSTEAELRGALAGLAKPEVQADETALKNLVNSLNDLSKQDVYVCPADKGRNDIKVDQSCKLDPANRTFQVIDDTVVEDFGFDLHGEDHLVLDPGKKYGLVLESNTSVRACAEKEVSCIRFRTHQPFFHFNDSTPGNDHDPKRYVFLAPKNAVIFGVVDPTLGEQVGVLNFSWKNESEESSTVVSAEDPVEALQTQLDFFNRTHPNFDGVKILLAQMGPERARALGAHFPEFQIVVTAADGERSTSELDIRTKWAEGPHAKAFVAIPSPYYDPQQRDRYEGIVHLGRVDVSYDNTFEQEKYVRNIAKPAAWILESKRIAPQEVALSKPVYTQAIGADPIKTQATLSANKDPLKTQSIEDSIGPAKLALANYAPLAAGPPPPTFFERIDDRFKECQEKTDPDYFNKIKLLTLCLMREQVRADVALVQKRDFFNELPNANLTNPAHFQEALDRIIWKGDLLTLLYVPGSALKNALDQSKKFDEEDGNALSLADERARGLQFLGVHFDSKSKKYIINEMPLDDKKIYAVATTDYVGAGDTGYPDLAKAALDPKDRADKFPNELIPISGIVCRGLFKDSEPSTPYCLANLRTTLYLDETNLTAESAGEPVTFGSKVAKFFKPTDNKWSTPLSLEDRVQRRPIWVLSLKNLSLTFSSLSNNLSDDEVQQTFGGVPTSGVTAGKTHTVAANVETRFSRSSHDYDLFLGSKVDYKLQSTGDVSPKLDQLNNRVTAEAGIVRNLLGGRGRSRLGATFTFHTEVPLAKPFTMFKLSGTDKLKITQSRSLLVLPRIGTRWQSDTNYFEGGAQVGREYKALGGYRFNSTGEVCLPNAAETFGDCITRLNKTTPPSVTKDTAGTPILERRRRAGLYWKAGLSVPLGNKAKYDFTDEGNFFFNSSGDNATNTRLWDSQKHSLKFSVFSSLSIGPSLQLLFFRNKVNHDFLIQRQLGFETSFAFDLFNRREKGIQVQHKP
jgi:hypothetical protein